MQNSNSITLMAVGDIMLGRAVGNVLKEKGYKYPFLHVAAVLKKADFVFGNLETPLSNRGNPCDAKSQSDPILRAELDAVTGLVYSGFNILNLANNHIMDYGQKALYDTISILSKHNIKYLGVGKNIREARKPLVIELRGIKVGFLGYSSSFVAGIDTPGCAPINSNIMKQDLTKLKERVDIIIVSLHHGVEYSDYPVPHHIELAHDIVDSGSCLVLGHHPHVLQGIEHYKNGAIAHSLGNFVFDLGVQEIKERALHGSLLSRVHGVDFDSDDRRVCESVILKCSLSNTGIKELSLIPLLINDNLQPELLQGEAGEALISRINQLSENIGNEDIPLIQKLKNVYVQDSASYILKKDVKTVLKQFHRVRLHHVKLVFLYWKSKFVRKIKNMV